jgi:hypothetical protein
MEATVPIVTETKDAVNQTIVTSDVDYVQEDVQARVSKPIVRHDVSIQ